MADATSDSDDEAIQLPTWTKALGWCGVAGLIYLLICAVSIISRGFAGLGSDAAHTMFAFASHPWVGLSVGVLGTVLIQSSTTTTAIAVTAVGSGALPIEGAIPIILGANVGTTVTTSLVALTFIGNRTEFRRALGASTVHDFYNWLALLIFFPIELIWHPLEHISGALTDALYGTDWLPNPAHFNFVRAATRPVESGVIHATSHVSSTLGPLFTIVIGALLILVAVRYLGKLLKLLMVGRARDILIKAVGRNPYLAMASGMGVTVVTQSSTITTSVLVPFAGTGILTPAQVYPVVVGSNLGTTFTVVFAAFAGVGPDAKIGLQAAFVHLIYNLFAIVVIYVIPLLRPVPLFCAEKLAGVASEHRWVLAVYIGTVFITLPALVIVLVGVV
ncbi:thymidylate synthase [Streptomyces chartreusis]|uniref:thymidylate synthase n=1 Tax=Streptomyces chartreusis TaxID=1969 RepID=UPI0019B4B83B|nr:thymidylate synthase [Streptomyces chartreusis]GGX44155.1 sodium:phosphate symporter [Streptomyces chartreusis]